MKKKIIYLLVIAISTINPAKAQIGGLDDIGPSIQGQILFHDIDLDGDVDPIMIGDYTVRWYENLGSGQLADAKLLIEQYSDVSYERTDEFNNSPFFDFDDDGDLDFLSNRGFNEENGLYFHENLGAANFNTPVLLDSVYLQYPRFVDIDNDGDLDAIGNTYFGSTLSYSIFDNGGFGAPVTLDTANSSSFYSYGLNDFDNNGYVDIVYIDAEDDSVVVLLNNASNFTYTPLFYYDIPLYGMKLKDFDNDGLKDIISTAQQGTFIYYKNLGGNNFQQIIFSNQGYIVTECPIDLDLDGDIDFVYGGNESVKISHNFNGDSLIPYGTEIFDQSNYGNKMLPYAADITGDQLPEVFFLWGPGSDNDQSLAYMKNNGSLNFDQPVYVDSIYIDQPDFIILEDINSDNKIDFLASNYYNGNASSLMTLRYQEPEGNYSNEINFEGFYIDNKGIGLVDYDQDSDIDIFAWTNNAGVFLKQDGGQFILDDSLVQYGSFMEVVFFADFTGNGFPDLLTSYNGDVGYIPNLGSGNFGNFVVIQSGMGANWKSSFLFEDIDNDGLKDILFAQNPGCCSGYHLAWYKNLGNGNFSTANIIADDYSIDDLHTGDFDNDGDLDVLVLKSSSTPGGGNFFWHQNYGNGNFNATEYSLDIWMDADYFVTHDFNNDGFTDFAFDLGQVYIAINNQDNTVSVHEILDETIIPGWSYGDGPAEVDIKLGDVDNDGDEDLFVVSTGSNRLSVLKNYFGSQYIFSGTIFYDLNENEVIDSNESIIPIVDLEVIPSNTNFYSVNNGDFDVNLDEGFHTLTFVQNPYWNLTTDSLTFNRHLTDQDPVYDSLIFGFYPDTFIVDLNGVLSSGIASCNDTVSYWIDVQNQGTLPSHGFVVVKPDLQSPFVSSQTVPSLVGADSIIWDFDTIGVVQNSTISYQTEIPNWTSSGDTLVSLLYVYGIDSLGDTTLFDIDTLEQIVICAYDPNVKIVSPQGDSIQGFIDPDAINELIYEVHFQNTGTDTAHNVKIIDQLSPYLDWSTFQFLSSSYPASVNLNLNGELTFEFNGINLTDTITNEPESHGFLKFSIEIDSNAQLGSQITNNALIFFDLNPAVVTNTTVNTLFNCNLPPPDIDTTTNYCYPEVLDFQYPVNGSYLNYSWFINGVEQSDQPNFQWDIVWPGSYEFELNVNGMGCSDTFHYDPILVIQDFNDSLNSVQFCEGDSAFFLGTFIDTSFTQIDTIYNSNGCATVITNSAQEIIIDKTISESIGQYSSVQTNASYVWIDCDSNTPIPGETSSVFEPNSSGSYAVVITHQGCTDTSDCFFYQDSTNSISINGNADIQLQPNPANFYLNVYNVPIESEMIIFDIQGRIIGQKSIMSEGVVKIELKNFAKGTYIMRIYTNEKVIERRFVKN